MESKPGQPLSVRVASASVVEATPTSKVDPEILDTVEQEGESNNLDGANNQADGDGVNIFDDEDIFGGEDAFVASPQAAALNELATVDAGEVDGTESLDLEAEGEGNNSEEGEDSEDGAGTFQIYSHDCLRCTELVPGLKKSEYIKARSFTKCHYENGNKECPAKSVQVVVGLPIPTIVKSYMEAFIDGDNGKIARIMARLSSKDEGQRQLANDAIKRAMAKHFAKSQ